MKIHFTSLGCARNLVDSEVMLGILLRAGYEITEELKQADFLIVNTCGFLEVARQESIDTIEMLVKEKKKGAKVVVAGCMVQKYGPGIEERFPGVHYFLGSGDMEKILDAVSVPEQGSSITSARSYLQQGEIPRMLSTPRHFAYLKIAEGCMKRCAFCIIPNIKGPLKSKEENQVLKEFRALLSQGVKEVILIAQDLGDFGKERKVKDGLVHLLKEMLKVEGDYWIRLLYLYPDEITDELIEVIASDKRICPYLDMPIQHVNDTILKAMRRKTSKTDIISILEKLRARMPHIVVRTSLMVGFPGETEEQFEELLEFVEKYPLDNVGIFKYSREEESHSAKLPGHIAEDVKQARFEKLNAKQLEMARRQNERFVGQKLPVIVEGTHPDSPLLMRGRFYGQCPDIDGQVIITDGRKVSAFGERYTVEITGVADYDLIGRVVSPTRKLCLV
ncbi:MAG: 30S ribosomal protein S12 methylthiotransferase RimO [Verrucomicrobia bacterium]|nr:30S ribosomal protein S12 methylthiotransferase RimO [Verrucomicrobiota bacterium]